ncbi:hypothetical protein KC19_12G131600 [Ceratodon purpureus]|uniref:Uncharacterized protein n=1 Tax=Ceratodon purpureus TaxID=3225 RepID=A0A8T0G6P4_CERPU|nr:hypothetical protein KC19_12G131600 [Ceratodon purpureus]
MDLKTESDICLQLKLSPASFVIKNQLDCFSFFNEERLVFFHYCCIRWAQAYVSKPSGDRNGQIQTRPGFLSLGELVSSKTKSVVLYGMKRVVFIVHSDCLSKIDLGYQDCC